MTGTGTTLNPIGPNSRIKTMAVDADGLSIGGLAASQTTLTHRSEIEAGGTEIRLPFVQRLENSGLIQGANGAGVSITDTTTGNASVTNSGLIQSGTYGMNYNNKTLTLLTNSGTIQGGTEAGVRAAVLTELENKAGGKIASTSSDGVRTTGSLIGTLKNEGEISGGRHGVSALTVALSNSGDITGGTSSAGSGDKAALMC